MFHFPKETAFTYIIWSSAMEKFVYLLAAHLLIYILIYSIFYLYFYKLMNISFYFT